MSGEQALVSNERLAEVGDMARACGAIVFDWTSHWESLSHWQQPNDMFHFVANRSVDGGLTVQ
jgi:hypothetical protein